MLLDQMLAIGLYGFVCFVCVIFTWQRLRYRLTRRGFRPSTAGLGNALQQLQVIAEPLTAYVRAEMESEEADDDQDGGPDDPVRHLHRQAAKIRRGEPIDVLTVRLRRKS